MEYEIPNTKEQARVGMINGEAWASSGNIYRMINGNLYYQDCEGGWTISVSDLDLIMRFGAAWIKAIEVKEELKMPEILSAWKSRVTDTVFPVLGLANNVSDCILIDGGWETLESFYNSWEEA